MKLVRFGERGSERPGLLDQAWKIRSLEEEVVDLGGETLAPQSLKRLANLNTEDLPLVENARLGPCVAGVGKIICIGKNYA
ncbi:MAG: ureidoglycolate lyase, partial [Lacipirellulaceae bacterium]